MKIAVVTPFYAERNAELRRCHESVLAQATRGIDVEHFVVSDGAEKDWFYWRNSATLLKLQRTNDFGNTPRLVGSAVAAARGADAVAFLDADNWYEPGHLELCVELTREASVASTRRIIWTDDGEKLGVDLESNGIEFVDVSCLFVRRPAFPVLSNWGFQGPEGAAVGDRIVWNKILEGRYSRVHSAQPTVNYTTNLAFHYEMFGLTPPDDSRMIVYTPDMKSSVSMSYQEYLRIQ